MAHPPSCLMLSVSLNTYLFLTIFVCRLHRQTNVHVGQTKLLNEIDVDSRFTGIHVWIKEKTHLKSYKATDSSPGETISSFYIVLLPKADSHLCATKTTCLIVLPSCRTHCGLLCSAFRKQRWDGGLRSPMCLSSERLDSAATCTVLQHYPQSENMVDGLLVLITGL